MSLELKVVLVDDEKNSREVLRKLITNFFPDIIISGEACNVDEAYELVNLHKPNIVFLDIQMPGENGFNLLKRFQIIPFEIIFVTSFDQYAVTAIKFNALDYLLKPFEISDLRNALEKGRLNIEGKYNSQPQIVNLIQNLETTSSDKKIAIHVNDKVKMINLLDVIYIQADGRYSKLIMSNSEIFITSKSLRDFEDFFSVTSPFMRISKSTIINTGHILEYSKGEPFMITLTGNLVLEVARRKKTEILEKLRKLM